MPENVIYGWRYISYIKSKKEIFFTDEELENIINAIKEAQLKPSIMTEIQHVNNLKQAHSASPTACPKCGAQLVRRVAKKGRYKGKEFLGCSNYPRCKYIHNINKKKTKKFSANT